MAERRARLLELGPPTWRLRLLDRHCDGCALGCGGRCNVFSTNDAGELTLSLASDAVPVGAKIGDAVLLSLDDTQLRRGAWVGYGRVWLGLLLGSALGFAIGRGLGIDADLPTLAGLVLGTSLAVVLSKKQVAGPRLAIIHANEHEPL